MASLKLKHVYKVYNGGVRAVNDFNLDIKDKSFVVLVGPSGCGKSTTLRMIAGLETITSGQLYIDNVLVNDMESKNRDIAMVFQSYALYPHMTVYQNMGFSLKLRHEKSAVIKEKVLKAAEILEISDLLDRKPKELSGGQRQRVALGRALVRDPKVFLLDEPLSNLDAKLRASMRSEIVKLHKRVKTTFVYVTHDQVEAMTMGDRIVVMKDGIIQQVGSPSEIYDNPMNTFVAGFIGTPQMNFFDVKLIAKAKEVVITLPNNKEVTISLKDLRDIQDEYISGEEKELTLGIRGEHLVLGDKGIDATVSFVEILGNTTNILCKLDGSDVEFNVTVQERSELVSGDKVKVSFLGKNVHLFDKETGKTIYKYGLEEVKDEK